MQQPEDLKVRHAIYANGAQVVAGSTSRPRAPD
jgi:hypothetical protein